MTKKERFVTLVQTAAIVESLSIDKLLNGKPRPRLLAAIAVNAATEVPEGKLPESLTEACEALVAYVYENTIPKPSWLIGIL